jgi:hypothetical protein
MKTYRTAMLAAAASLLAASAAQAASLPAGGYTQNFDGMATGTAAPMDWTVWNGESGTANNTWTSSILANGATGSVASMVATTAALTAFTGPTANNNNGFNAAVSAATVSDRILATAPTTVSGAALQLSLTNNTGFAFNALNVAFDTVRFTAAGTANELPGYQLFFSLGGNSWANAGSFNPTLTTVPNSAGVSPIAGVLNLGASVAPGATVLLRWVDDNAVQSSPDQIIGLNNVSISAVPEPGSVALLLAGLAVVGWTAQRHNRRG